MVGRTLFEPIRQHSLRRRRLAAAITSTLLLGFATPQLRAQQTGTGSVTGRVIDAGVGTPLRGASVRVGLTQLGAQTGDDGRYTIRGVTPGTVDLQVNRIGYEVKRERQRNRRRHRDGEHHAHSGCVLAREVVTTVTGTQSKAEISNTVATIDVARRSPRRRSRPTGQLLSGRASGVQVISSGAVGSGSRIRIRGQSSLSLSNDPIVYVDGVRVDAKHR